MRYIKKFQKFNEGGPATAPSPETKPEPAPVVEPGTRPAPNPRPTPIRRDRPEVEPDPMGEAPSDKVKPGSHRMAKKAKAEEVAERFISLAREKGLDLEKYKK